MIPLPLVDRVTLTSVLIRANVQEGHIIRKSPRCHHQYIAEYMTQDKSPVEGIQDMDVN